MITFNTIIFTHHGRTYRFTKQHNQYHCHTCYWQGTLLLPDQTHPHHRAYIEQKYTPYQQIWADKPIPTQEHALKWIATALQKQDTTP